MIPSLRECIDIARRMEERNEQILRRELARRAREITEEALTPEIAEEMLTEEGLAESTPDRPEQKTDAQAMPLSDFALPVVGLPVAGRTLPDSGPLGDRIRPESTNAARSVILEMLSRRERLTRHGRK